MCESSVFILMSEGRELVMEGAARVIIEGDGVVCINTLGEKKSIENAVIAEVNLMRHEIVLRPLAD